MPSLNHSLLGTTAVRLPDARGYMNIAAVLRRVGGATVPIDALSITWALEAPEQIALTLTPTRAIGPGAVRVRWRPAAGGTWSGWIRALRVDPAVTATDGPAVVDCFAVAIRRLSPGSSYIIEIEHIEAGQSAKYASYTRTTLALRPAAGAATKTATTGNAQAQITACVPGDVLELAAANYANQDLVFNCSGTEAQPIYIRCATPWGAVLSRSTVGDVATVTGNHLVIEDIRVAGTGTDAGVSLPSSVGIRIVGNRTRNTFRRIWYSGVDQALVSDDAQTQTHDYESFKAGNNPHTRAAVDSNQTWNDDATRLPGESNCSWNCTVQGFGDATSVVAGVDNKWVWFYRYHIPWTGDDPCEGDYFRCGGFYDSYVTNAGTALSLDTLYGGPFYYDRNIVINTARGPWKFNGGDQFKVSGALVNYNTIVRTNGVASVANYGAIQYGNSNGLTIENWTNVGNLYVFRGSTSNAVIWHDQVGNSHMDWDYNGVWPNGPIHWGDGTSYSTMAAAIAGVGQVPTTPVIDGTGTQRDAHSKVVESNPWTANIVLGADFATQFLGAPSMALLASSAAKYAGLPIPGVTDGYTGAAPDIGAVIEGQVQPVYGCSWAPVAFAGAGSTRSSSGAATLGAAPALAGSGRLAVVGGGTLTVPGTFTPSYSLPTTVNTSLAFGTNALVDVAPAPYTPGVDPVPWLNATMNAYCGPVWCPQFTTAGALVFSNTGGHTDGSNYGLVYLDVTDGQIKRLTNGNGVAETGGDLLTSATSGYPYYEITAASPAGMPGPAHRYATAVAVPIGSKGSILSFTAAGTNRESWVSRASHIQDLNTRVWSRATNNLTTNPGETQANDLGGGFEYGVAYDDVAGRVYLLWFGAINEMSTLYYFRLSDMSVQSITGFTGSQAQNRVDFYLKGWAYPFGRMLMHFGGNGAGSLMGMDTTSDSTILQGWKTLTQTGPLPDAGAVATWHPINGKFYYTTGDGRLFSLTPPAGNKMTGTWTWAQLTIGGDGFPARPGALSNSHYTCLQYAPATNMLVWWWGHGAGQRVNVKV